MKVLMFGWEFPPYNSGGLGVACLGLTRALLHLGVDVTFVLPKKFDFSNSWGNRFKMLFANDLAKNGIVKFQQIDTPLTPYITSAEYELLRSPLDKTIYGNSLLEEVRRYAILARKIAESEDFDVIHAHDWLSFLAGLEAKKIKNKPLIVHVHATEFDRGGGNGVNQFVYDIEREGMQKADKIIAVSNLTKNIIVKHYGVQPDKVHVVHNGINEEDYARGEEMSEKILALKRGGNKIVLFVGRITLQKGPDYFVKVAKKVLHYYPKVYFVVSGSGDMEWKMIREVAEQGMSDRFIFTGFLRGDNLNKVYKAADLFIMPSVSEPFGITPLESIINGTPVLISRQSGVGELLSHALKTDFWDVNEMTNKVVSVLSNKSLQVCLGKNGREEIKKIDWMSAAKKCANVYSLVI